MQIDPFTKIELPPRQLHLREDRIGVDIGQSTDLPIFFWPLECARDVDEQISGLDHLLPFRVGKPKPLGLPGKTIGPLVGQSVARHDAGEVFDVEVAAFAQSALAWIVGPLPRILDIVHIMAELREPEDILQIIPRHSAKRVLGNESSHDDTKSRRHACFPPDLHARPITFTRARLVVPDTPGGSHLYPVSRQRVVFSAPKYACCRGASCCEALHRPSVGRSRTAPA